MTTQEKLAALREEMRRQGLDAWVVPSADAHQSEYVAGYWKTRQWLSGFTGSAGTVVVTMEDAGLWTDGRYFIQAANQLEGSGIRLFKMGLEGTPTFYEWLAGALPAGARVGFDGRTVSAALADSMEKAWRPKEITPCVELDLAGGLWQERPILPDGPIFEHDVEFAGKSRREKIGEVREKLKKARADAYLLASLDDIAWLLNLRGGDVECTPVFYAYVYLDMAQVTLFADGQKVPGPVRESLAEDGIALVDYSEVLPFLQGLEGIGAVYIDPARISTGLKGAFPSGTEFVQELDITTTLKAVKNDVEIACGERSQVRDGIAMVRFLRWLKEAVKTQELDEAAIDHKLWELRSRGQHFKGPSFATIAGYMENAAQMHYSAQKGSCKTLKPEGMLLVDSGGQYLDGTTDITRTIVLGPVTPQMKWDFTYVLKSHIGLARARFLYGSTGANLDILARRPMWEQGLDYKCGTGHGVGFFLSVHEGPQNFRQTAAPIPLEPGMVITNEPGIYREGQWGIRTENTLLVREAVQNENGRFLKFETISYCPIDLEGIDPGLLEKEELEWLNAYHQTVWEKLSPGLDEDERRWLREATAPVLYSERV